MRTARLLPVSPSMHCVRGAAPRGCLLPGVCLPLVRGGGLSDFLWSGMGGVYPSMQWGRSPHPPCEQNDR